MKTYTVEQQDLTAAVAAASTSGPGLITRRCVLAQSLIRHGYLPPMDGGSFCSASSFDTDRGQYVISDNPQLIKAVMAFDAERYEQLAEMLPITYSVAEDE